MNETVSVLMCVFNTPTAYLIEACESILSQTYGNIEFVIVDDASTDKDVTGYLEELVKKESIVNLYKNPENLGLTASLNVGIEKCHGKYIARMDSDDISLPERIKKQAEYLEEHEDVALVGSNIVIFGDGMQERDLSKEEDIFADPEIYRIQSLFRHSGPAHPTFMFRASFLKSNGISYRVDIKKAQDYGIMADILRFGGKIQRINETLLRYRIHSGQITETSETEQKAYQCRVSYDYIKAAFPNLSDDECMAASLIGCSADPGSLISTISSSEQLKSACGYLLEKPEIIKTSGIYISAVKKMIRYNDENGIYERDLFSQQLRKMWWKKAIGVSRTLGRPWGMTPYTLSSYMKIMNMV